MGGSIWNLSSLAAVWSLLGGLTMGGCSLLAMGGCAGQEMVTIAAGFGQVASDTTEKLEESGVDYEMHVYVPTKARFTFDGAGGSIEAPGGYFRLLIARGRGLGDRPTSGRVDITDAVADGIGDGQTGLNVPDPDSDTPDPDNHPPG